MKITQTNLPSGLTVMQVPMPGVSSVTALLLANTGSRYEAQKQQGIAHFFEHIVFKGTRDFPDAHTLSAAIDGIGADFNAFTSKEYTGYYVKAASRHLEHALHVLSDMLLHPLIPQADIEREKGVIIEELNMYQDTPMRLVDNLFEQTFYAGTGLEHDIIGTKETISATTQADFHQFLQSWYSLHNMTLVLAGDASVLKQQDTDKLLEKFFGSNPQERSEGARDVLSLCEHAQPQSGKVHLRSKKTEQSHFIYAWPGLHRAADDRYVLSVLSSILGGTMSSRLFTEVREKRGLCYYVHSSVDTYHDVGSFGASAGVDPSRIEEALSVIQEEFAAVVSGKKPITAQELERAQENIIGSTTLSLEDSRSVAQYVGMKQLLMGEIQTPDEVFAKIKAVSLDDLNRLMERLIDHKPTLALVGPHDDAQVFERFVT